MATVIAQNSRWVRRGRSRRMLSENPGKRKTPRRQHASGVSGRQAGALVGRSQGVKESRDQESVGRVKESTTERPRRNNKSRERFAREPSITGLALKVYTTHATGGGRNRQAPARRPPGPARSRVRERGPSSSRCRPGRRRSA